jgi:3-oxoacyl-[acyl-carrier protein] reductase
MSCLRNQTLLVSGGSRGIGRAIVREALRAGANVALCARQPGKATRALEAEAEQLGGTLLTWATDVRDERSVAVLFDAVNQRFGPIDALVNNAGVSREALLIATDDARWDEVMATNLEGTFLMTRRALSDFLSSGRAGRVVSIGSLAEHGTASNASYAASKGGVSGLMRAVAAQYAAQGVRANTILAGYVQTELTQSLSLDAQRLLIERCPQQRAANPEEIANLAVFLASQASAGITGLSVHAAGGMREMPF